MGHSSTLDSPVPELSGPDPKAPVADEIGRGSDAHRIARAYALDILVLAPGPTTDAIIEGAVHRTSGRRARPADRTKVHEAVREEAYRRQRSTERVRRRGTQSTRRVDDAPRRGKRRRVLFVLALLLLVALVTLALAVGVPALNDETGADETGPAVVRGRVEAADGDAAAAARITATDPEGATVAEVSTDADGAFVIGDLSEGGYVLVVADAGGQLEPTSADVFVEAGDDVAVTIVLDAP